jgi:hypothetical protein
MDVDVDVDMDDCNNEGRDRDRKGLCIMLFIALFLLNSVSRRGDLLLLSLSLAVIDLANVQCSSADMIWNSIDIRNRLNLSSPFAVYRSRQ